VQNEPNFPNTKNQRNPLFTNKLRKYLPFRPPEKRTQTNPNEPKANPIFRSSGAPKAKTNPNEPKQTQFIAAQQNQGKKPRIEE
jgi:hypothetical protein